MALWIIGIDYQNTTVDQRAQLAFDSTSVSQALSSLRHLPGVDAVVLLSTCNRTEVYADARNPNVIEQWFARYLPNAASLLYKYTEADAVQHLFKVATGLESMALGEPQILGQVKQAWYAAQVQGVLNTRLDHVFQYAFYVAKQARSSTRLGEHSVSVAFASVKLAQALFANFMQSTVMLIGAGETNTLIAKYLHENRVKRLIVVNRTLQHAQKLAEQYNGYALSLNGYMHHLSEVDVLFAATASPECLLTRSQVDAALQQRRCKPMLFFDLSVPRALDPKIGQLPDAYLYTIDDLEKTIKQNWEQRRLAAQSAQKQIEAHVARYQEAQRAKMHQENIKQLRAFGEATRLTLTARAQQQLANGRPAQEVIDQLAHTLTNRLLHPPTVALREAALNNDTQLFDAMHLMYGLSSQDASLPLASPLFDISDDADSAL